MRALPLYFASFEWLAWAFIFTYERAKNIVVRKKSNRSDDLIFLLIKSNYVIF